jgi:hypothetical protein
VRTWSISSADACHGGERVLWVSGGDGVREERTGGRDDTGEAGTGLRANARIAGGVGEGAAGS